jgi:dodecin
MSGVVKVIELVGSSDEGWQQAAENAVSQAAKTLADLVGVEVIGWTANIGPDKQISDYRATVKIAFKVKGSDDLR